MNMSWGLCTQHNRQSRQVMSPSSWPHKMYIIQCHKMGQNRPCCCCIENNFFPHSVHLGDITPLNESVPLACAHWRQYCNSQTPHTTAGNGLPSPLQTLHNFVWQMLQTTMSPLSSAAAQYRSSRLASPLDQSGSEQSTQNIAPQLIPSQGTCSFLGAHREQYLIWHFSQSNPPPELWHPSQMKRPQSMHFVGSHVVCCSPYENSQHPMLNTLKQMEHPRLLA